MMNSFLPTTNIVSFFSSPTIFSVQNTLSVLFNDTRITTTVITAMLIFVVINSLRQKQIQGLPCWPFFGMLPSLIIGLRMGIYNWISETVCRHNKTVIFKGPWFSDFNFFVVSDPRNLEYILKTKSSNFPRGPSLRDVGSDLLGDGIFNIDGEMWLRQRKTLSSEFLHSSKFRELTTSSLIDLVHSRVLPFLEQSVQNSVSFDLQDMFLRLSFDNTCFLAIGVDPCSLASDGLPDIPFAQAFHGVLEAIALRYVMPTCVWKIMKYFDLGSEKRLRKSLIVFNELFEQTIKQRKNELSSSNFNDGHEIKVKKTDLLTVLMGLQEENDETQSGMGLSNKLLRDVCINFIFAGKDTSSLAMTWFFWIIDQNPMAEERILEEIMKIVREKEDKNNLVFSRDDVNKMEYLHAALTETLRLYPVLPMYIRQAAEDDVFPDGITIKKGEKVYCSVYPMGRMKGIWGDDCLEYKPERWLKDGRFVSESNYKLNAFGGGSRMCLGKDFAYFQMKFVVASILYRYRVKVANNHQVVPKFSITLFINHGLKVNLCKRDKC